MTYLVLARKYRPLIFADLVGQDATAAALLSALKRGKTAHAYLFVGIRGVGKTTAARILAAALNCAKPESGEPCGKCDSCLSIRGGTDIDVVEMDAATHTSVDDIRDLRERVNFRPARGKHKVYIIDEIHMLSKSAFNAFLKTLEEPPDHAVFIFATTEPEKLPDTIISRCQRFDFRALSTPKIAARLEQIAKLEKLELEPGVAHIIARRGRGSMRDALTDFDQVIAFSGDGISVEKVHDIFGTLPADVLADLVGGIAAGDTKKVLEILHDARAAGRNAADLTRQLVEHYRDLMIVHVAGPESPMLTVSVEDKKVLAEQAGSLTLDTLNLTLQVLTATEIKYKEFADPETLLEMALITLSRAGDLVKVADLAEGLSAARSAVGGAVSTGPLPAPRPVSAAVPEPDRSTSKAGVDKKETAAAGARSSASAGAKEIADNWQTIVDKVREHDKQLAAFMFDAAVGGAEGGVLTISVPEGYVEHKRKLEGQSAGRVIREAVSSVTGQAFNIEVIEAGEPPAYGGRENGGGVPPEPPRAEGKPPVEVPAIVERFARALDGIVLDVAKKPNEESG